MTMSINECSSQKANQNFMILSLMNTGLLFPFILSFSETVRADVASSRSMMRRDEKKGRKFMRKKRRLIQGRSLQTINEIYVQPSFKLNSCTHKPFPSTTTLMW